MICVYISFYHNSSKYIKIYKMEIKKKIKNILNTYIFKNDSKIFYMI